MSTKEPIFKGMYYNEEIRKHPTVKEYVLAKKKERGRAAQRLDFFPPSKEWFEAGLKRLGAVLSGHPELADRTPVVPSIMGFAAKLHSISIGDLYRDPESYVKCLLHAHEMFDAPPFLLALYADYWCEDYGGVVQWPVGEYMSAPAIMEYPLKTAEDVENLHIWDVDEMPKKSPSHIYHMLGQEAAKKVLGPAFTPMAFPYGMFTVAGAMVQPGTLMLWVMKQPEVVHKLLKKVVENSVNHCTAVAKEYGSATILTGSVLAGDETLSPEQCRKFNIVYLADMVKRAKRNGAGPGALYHLCGSHKADWPIHAELVPLDEASMFHVAYYGREPADLTDVIPAVGNKCPLMGNIATSLMHIGNPKEVYEEAKRQILTYRENPKGFIMGVACECPPMAPVANVYALMKAAKDIGPLPSKA
jgi:uroporphyrinogen decarboxylase